MARPGGSVATSVFMAVILWVAVLGVLIVAPAAYVLVGPDELWRIWGDFWSGW